MAIRSFGTKLKVGSAALGGLTSVKPPGVDVAFIDVTGHDSTGGFKEYLGGLKDSGEISYSGNYKRGDAGVSYCMAHPGETAAFEIELSNGDKFSGNCIVGKVEFDAPLDDKVGYSGSLKVTGPVTFTAGA